MTSRLFWPISFLISFLTSFLDHSYSNRPSFYKSYLHISNRLIESSREQKCIPGFLHRLFRHMSDCKVKIGPKIEDVAVAIAGSGVFEGGKRNAAHLVFTFLGISVLWGRTEGNTFFSWKLLYNTDFEKVFLRKRNHKTNNGWGVNQISSENDFFCVTKFQMVEGGQGGLNLKSAKNVSRIVLRTPHVSMSGSSIMTSRNFDTIFI